MNFFRTKKFRYGSVSFALTVAIIAVVILVNAIFTALTNKFVWYLDMTAPQMYTLTDEAKNILDGMNKDAEVEIILCAPEDQWAANTAQNYVLETVKEICKEFDNITYETVDVHKNPSKINPYKVHTKQNINSQSVIVANGPEQCRVFSLEMLYTFDNTGTTAIGYNGEQKLVSAILSVTQTDIPKACLTINHGESESANYVHIKDAMVDAGYEVLEINLADEPIPEDCRLIVVFDPQADFLSRDEFGKTSEITKLENFLDGDNSMMVFFDHETEELFEFELFLKEWGIGIARDNLANTQVADPDSSYDTEGYVTVGQYVTKGLGADLTTKLRFNGNTVRKNPKPVVFGSVTPLVNTYDVVSDPSTGAWSGSYSDNGIQRVSHDVFTSTNKAMVVGNNRILNQDQLEEMRLYTPADDAVFSYMRVTNETKIINQEVHNSYVLACGSTDFAYGLSNSQYGNHNLFTYACSVIGRSEVSVSLDCKYFADSEISNITAKDANQYTVVLTVVPASIIFLAGVYIMVRRKYA